MFFSVSTALFSQTVPAAGYSETISAPSSNTLSITAGDLVQIDVYGSPELSGRYRVSQGGDIDLILGGRLHVAGLNAEQAAVETEQILRDKQIVLAPHVSVFVREYSSQGVTVLGEVKNPGIYPALGEHKLYDLIAAAGGFTVSASNVVTIIHQANPSTPQIVELPNSALRDGTGDVTLSSGDRVIVSTAGIVYVIGDVGRPGGFVLSRNDSQLSVLKALALAQGINHTAKLGSTTILSKTSAGLVHKDLDLKEILAHRAPDPVLAAGDVLYVPSSTAKIIGYRSLEAAFAATSAFAITR